MNQYQALGQQAAKLASDAVRNIFGGPEPDPENQFDVPLRPKKKNRFEPSRSTKGPQGHTSSQETTGAAIPSRNDFRRPRYS